MMFKVTVITINLNNALGLQKTIQSVFRQTYRNVEYIVIDGGSIDDSIRVVEENKENINYWISEPDSGVYSAMNKGIIYAKGEYFLFLNSGDYFINENVLENIAKEIDGTDLIYGNIKLVESSGKSWIGVYPRKLSIKHFFAGSLPHPATFIKKSLFEKEGSYDEKLKICGDWKFFLNSIVKHKATYKHVEQIISVFNLDGLSSDKGNQLIIAREKEQVILADHPAQLSSFFHARNESSRPRKQTILDRIKNYF